jgi:hypothetical protein
MSQLLTSTTSDDACLLPVIHADIERVPVYLTKQNEAFQKRLREARQMIETPTKPDETKKEEQLRRITILIYKLMHIQQYRLLWAAYLKAGLGELARPSEKQVVAYAINVPIWPHEVKAMITSKDTANTHANETIFNFVNGQLNALDQRLQQYQNKLNNSASHCQGYTPTIHRVMEAYVHQGVFLARMETEHKVQLVDLDYHIRALKLDYVRRNPNMFQVSSFS